MKSIRAERLPARLAKLVRELPEDPWVRDFERAGVGHGALRDVLRRALRRVVSDFDADGLLGTYPMALYGETSWRDLIGERRRLLDIGAGSGAVTEHARALAREIVTTEVSGPMVRRLRRAGFECHRVDLSEASVPDLGRFDAVALSNVLDRCARPQTLLRTAISLLEAEGVLVISMPLPARPHVDVGGVTVDPDEPVGGHGDDFEGALVDLVEQTLEPCGLVIQRLCRTPYLSRGLAGELHRLDAVVVVGTSTG